MDEKADKKNYAIIKLPMKIENMEKANKLLGNKKELYSKLNGSNDLYFDFFYNKLTLENYFSNDLLLQRKAYRNKKDHRIKYKYSVLGKIKNKMESSSLEDFIFINEQKTNLEDLQNYIIPKNEYEEEIKDKNKDKEIGLNEESHIISNLIKRKHKKLNNNEEKENFENFFSFIQPVCFANYKNSSQNIPKLMKDKIIMNQIKDNSL